MNETNQPVLTTAKPKRTRKPKARAARVIDPEVAAIRQQAKEQVRQLKMTRASGGVLRRIQAMVPRLSQDHVRLLNSQLVNILSTASAPEQAGPVTGIN